MDSSVLLAVLMKSSWFGKFAHRFGALMFFPLAMWDNSPIPSLGGSDALLIILAASNHELWWVYSLVATVAAVIGAWPMYRLGNKSGEEALDKQLGERRAKKIRDAFHRHGFLSIFIGAVAPPPVPTAAFIGTAGAMNYPPRRFLLALASGRLLRFALVGYIASRYGRSIFQFFTKYYKPAMWTLIVLGVAGGIFAVYHWRKARRRKQSEDAGRSVPDTRAA